MYKESPNESLLLNFTHKRILLTQVWHSDSHNLNSILHMQTWHKHTPTSETRTSRRFIRQGLTNPVTYYPLRKANPWHVGNLTAHRRCNKWHQARAAFR